LKNLFEELSIRRNLAEDDQNEVFEITGGEMLVGTIKNQGSKNASLPIAVASLLTDEEVVLKNVPCVLDIRNIVEVLRLTGTKVVEGKTTRICASSISNPNITAEAARRIRSSILVPAALISKFTGTKVPLPGGDSIGTRKIDAYAQGLSSLGVKFKEEKGFVYAEANRIRGAEIRLHFPSVTGTEGIIIAATLADGKTIIHNAAKEPEVVDLCNFLNSMGARIKGAGTRTIKVVGVESLHGTEYAIIPDRIVAGTFMAAAAITGGNLLIEDVIPCHLGATIQALRKTELKISQSERAVKVESTSKHVKATDVTTAVYPGFPTDMQPILMALMATADGASRIRETLYDGRFTHVDDLKKMGALIEIDGDVAVVEGVEELKCANVKARDLRSGAALTLAGLVAEGVTEVSGVYQIDRGYDRLDETLSRVGAKVKRIRGNCKE
jgi:UDP-N-acetylglucosamine 1-carboxyvinyltransferase